jgi:hypothetical protein
LDASHRRIRSRHDYRATGGIFDFQHGPRGIFDGSANTPDLDPTNARRRASQAIQRHRNPAAFLAAGLSYDTTFDLRQTLDLPFSAEWFSVPPGAPHGQVPRLGMLHPSLVKAVQAAFRAVTS